MRAILSAMPRRSTSYHLFDVILGGKLAEFVADRRAAGKSWRMISHELWDATGQRFSVSHEVLRRWFPDRDGEAA